MNLWAQTFFSSDRNRVVFWFHWFALGWIFEWKHTIRGNGTGQHGMGHELLVGMMSHSIQCRCPRNEVSWPSKQLPPHNWRHRLLTNYVKMKPGFLCRHPRQRYVSTTRTVCRRRGSEILQRQILRLDRCEFRKFVPTTWMPPAHGFLRPKQLFVSIVV